MPNGWNISLPVINGTHSMRARDMSGGCSLFLRVGMAKTRGQKSQVRWGSFKGGLRGNFITWRMVGLWNKLPGEVVGTDTIITRQTWI